MFVFLGAMFLSSCEVGKVNPAIPASATAARDSLRSVQRVEAPRPLVILAGWRVPGVGPARIAPVFRQMYGDENVLTVNFFTSMSFDRSRKRVVEAVQERWPSLNSDTTVEVNVIGHSMGGIVARYASLPEGVEGFPERLSPSGRRLKIGHCFTIASPHRGARLAPYFAYDPTARDMIRGSQFLDALDEHWEDADFEITPYVVKGDVIVGVKGAGPRSADRAVPELWLANRLPLPSHLNGMGDPRITADIIKRLGAMSQ